MNLRTDERIERAIWKELASANLSPSHDRWHIDRVMSFARQLQAIYGGDPDVLSAAVVLHDLGRDDPTKRGQDSIDESVKHAREILARIGLPADKIDQVLTAIEEHDKPEVTPSTVEGRILKDADFLGGFGAWGILRICMWAGETGAGVPQVMDHLERRLPKRLANLEFPESQRLASEEMLFASMFLSRLKQSPVLVARPHRGLYVALEGISGTGKDTQADLLQKRLEIIGHTVEVVREPTDMDRKARRSWQERTGGKSLDPVIEMFLLISGRYELMQRTVWPALVAGHTVISNRSLISTLIYQQNEVYDSTTIAFMHSFVPSLDLVLLLDLDAETAFSRIIKAGRRELGSHEYLEQLRMHRPQYLDLARKLLAPQALRIIDASPSINEVAEQIWLAVGRCLSHPVHQS